jgi:hypothetical protein
MPASVPGGLIDVAKLPAAKISSVAFFDSEGRRTRQFMTGDEARAEVEYVAHEPVEDVVIEVYFYSIFGNLHSHFSTNVDGDRLDLPAGRGIVEFICPELPLDPAAFNVEAAIKRRGSSFNEHLDYKHAASISVAKGKPVQGAFHTPHRWRMKSVTLEKSNETDADAVVRNT